MQPSPSCGYKTINSTSSSLQEHSAAGVITIDFKELEEEMEPFACKWSVISTLLGIALHKTDHIRQGLSRDREDYFILAMQRMLRLWVSAATDNEVNLSRLVYACANSCGGDDPAAAEKIAEKYKLVFKGYRGDIREYEPFKVKINLPERKTGTADKAEMEEMKKTIEELRSDNVNLHQCLEEAREQMLGLKRRIDDLEQQDQNNTRQHKRKKMDC